MKLLQLCEPGKTPLPHQDDKKEPSSEGLTVGIDLGTTHSLVALSMNNQPRVFDDDNGNALFPSVIAIDEKGDYVVGQQALDVLALQPENALRSSKRFMGKGALDSEDLAYATTIDTRPRSEKTSKDQGMVGLKIANKRCTPVEAAARIVKGLIQRVETKLDTKVTQAVITVPAYFDDAARQATRQAAEIAGIKVLRLLNEPTAAALAYGLDQEVEGLYAVYDLGGGTFDISILELDKGVFRVLATNGDLHLGGDDIDLAIVNHWLDALQIKSTKSIVQLLLIKAKKAKEQLSSIEKFSGSIKLSGKLYTLTLDRSILYTLTDHTVDKTIDILKTTLLEKSLSLKDLDGLILVGGSTKMPYIQEKLTIFYGSPPLCILDPERVIAYGAALQAEALTTKSDHILLDIIPLSLGLETMGGLVEKIIERNTPIPVTKAQEFTTYQDGQTSLKLHVVQGEREHVSNCRSLATFTLRSIPPQVAGMPRIKVTFQVDADSLLTVSAQELTTGTSQEVQIKPTYGLQEEDMAKLIEEGFIHAQEDMEGRLLTEECVEAKRTLLALDKALDKDGALLSQEERTILENQKIVCLDLLKSNSRDAIASSMKTLEELLQPFAAKRMQTALNKSLKGKSINSVDIDVLENND